MGDFNAALNDTAKPFNLAAMKILEWEKIGDIRILNNKQIPNRVPYRKGDQANCLDLKMISPGLEDRTFNYKLDVDQEWSPARAEPTGQGKIKFLLLNFCKKIKFSKSHSFISHNIFAQKKYPKHHSFQRVYIEI